MNRFKLVNLLTQVWMGEVKLEKISNCLMREAIMVLRKRECLDIVIYLLQELEDDFEIKLFIERKEHRQEFIERIRKEMGVS